MEQHHLDLFIPSSIDFKKLVVMPRVQHTKHRVQRAFAPLIFNMRFQPERLLTPPPLLWDITFPSHVDGTPAEDAPVLSAGSPTDSAPSVKIKRPAGEPGRKGERGYNVKLTLDLPEGVYEDLLVRYNAFFF